MGGVLTQVLPHRVTHCMAVVLFLVFGVKLLLSAQVRIGGGVVGGGVEAGREGGREEKEVEKRLGFGCRDPKV